MFEQRSNTKFGFKLEKSASETLIMLRTVNDKVAIKRSAVFEWHKRFKEGKM